MDERKEFYRWFAEVMDKKIRQVDSCQITTDMISSMKNRLSAWTEHTTYQSDALDEVDEVDYQPFKETTPSTLSWL